MRGLTLTDPAFVGAAAARFSPLSLSPALWLDASDTSTITASSGSVSQWNDKSGNSLHFSQADGASQPKTGTRSINSLNAIDFDGSSDVMGAGDVLDLGTNSITIISVAAFDTMPATNQGRTLIGKYKATPLAGSWLQLVESAGTPDWTSVYRDGTANRIAKKTNLTDFTPVLWITTIDRAAGSISQTLDSVAAGSASFTPDTSTSHNNVTPLSIGALRNTNDNGYFGNYFFDGLIAEIIVCLSVLTAQQISDVSTYLNTKWAL